MAEYIEKEQALMQLTGSFPEDMSLEKYISLVITRLNKLSTADVIERSEFDRTVQAFKVLVEIKNKNLTAMRGEYYALEKEYAELKGNIDKAIEEMRVEYNNIDYHANKLLGASYGIRKSIEILKRNIGE